LKRVNKVAAALSGKEFRARSTRRIENKKGFMILTLYLLFHAPLVALLCCISDEMQLAN